MMSDVLIISGAMPSRLPHVMMYINILEKHHIKYDIIAWNRRGDKIENPSNYYVYNHDTNDSYPPLKKAKEIFHFFQFVRRFLMNKEYKGIIIFEVADSLLFYSLLSSSYNKRYIFDIRDYSPVLKYPFSKLMLKSLINHSKNTIISSPAFKSWLPSGFSYVLSHNIDMGIFDQLYNEEVNRINNNLTILTIGNLRDPNMNCSVASSFANDKNYNLQFVGDGAALPVIKSYCNKNQILNVSFHGHYDKNEELGFYYQADIINCCMENNQLSNFLLSNRIYLAALTGKPILCNVGSYQSSVVEKFHLGCVVKDSKNIKPLFESYLSSFNIEEYKKGREQFLASVRNDQLLFSNVVISLIENN